MQQHLILTNGRSGSNAFVQMLNQHPRVTNYGEVLGPWTTAARTVRPFFRGRDGAARYLDWLYASGLAHRLGQAASAHAKWRKGLTVSYKKRGAISTVGLKEFALNFERMGLNGYLPCRPQIRLIALLRDDPLARFVSTRTLSTTNVVAQEAGVDVRRPAQSSLWLDPETVVLDLDDIERENELVRSAARHHQGSVHHVRYEDFFAAPPEEQQAAMNDLQEFIGVEPRRLSLRHVKLRQRPLSAAISNYAEIREQLAPTHHARWLE